MTDPGMKCTRCRQSARHRFPAHNVRFCDSCFDIFFRRQVEKAIKEFRMLVPGQRVLVAVSGGKDSLALWRVLDDLGYDTEGFHLCLELGDFSDASLQSCRLMAERLGLPLHTTHLGELSGGLSMQELVWANRRQFCSVCGTMKRTYMNRMCRELGFDTVATGHHLDDETGRLLGNILHQHDTYLENMWPVLEAGDSGFARRVKPLCRLDGSEVKAYVKVHDLPVAQGKCRFSKGATLHYYQRAMSQLEQDMPGTKHNFYLQFLRGKGGPPPLPKAGDTCRVCGSPTIGEVCSACRLLEKGRQWKAKREERERAEAADKG